jgi:hypothetical protein
MILVASAATEQQKPHARHCLRLGEPHRITDDYLRAWLQICRNRPDVNFYAYTKEVRRFRRLVEPDPPPNFLWVYSYGYLSRCQPSTNQSEVGIGKAGERVNTV